MSAKQQPRSKPEDPANRPESSPAQERAYDEVVRGKWAADLPPGPQDALTREVPPQGPARTPDDEAARDAVEEVRREERSADRHADPGFRRHGG